MMVLLRLVFGLLLAMVAGCFVAYVVTHDGRWRQRGLRLLRWTVGAALAFFAVLFVQTLRA
jgi:hypothetical protein